MLSWVDRLALRAASTPTTAPANLPGAGAGLGNSLPGGRNSGGLAATASAAWSTPGAPQMPDWDGRSAIENGYYRSVWVMRGLQTIADTIASLPFRAGVDPAQPAQTVPGAPLARLLGPASVAEPGGPNPTTSSRAFWAWSITQKLATGKMAWELQRDGGRNGQIVGLWPLVSFLLNPIASPDGTARYFDAYEYQLPVGKRQLDGSRVFYAWRPSQRDWRQPESLLEAAGLAVSISVAIERHMWSLLRNGLVARHVVTSLPIEESDQRRAWEEKFVSEFTGFDNAGKPIFDYVEPDPGGKLGDVGVRIQPLATSPADAQLEWLANWAKNETLVALGVPESLIGNASQRIYANADAEYRNFWTTRVLQVVTELQDDVNTWLAPQIGSEVGWFDLSHVVALQPPQPFAQPALKDMLDEGVVSVADAQHLLGVGSSGALDATVAPVGEESSGTQSPGMGTTRADTLLWESRTYRSVDGTTGVLPDGWRWERRRANTVTLADGSAFRWQLVRPAGERIVLAPSRVESRGYDRAAEILGRVERLRDRRTPRTPVASSVPEPFGSPSGPGLWHHKGWQLPPYIQHVAHELVKDGRSESEAIGMAVGIVKDWSAGHDGHGHKVSGEVQAAAAKNIAAWEALKAAASSKSRAIDTTGPVSENGSAGMLLPKGPIPHGPTVDQATVTGPPHRFQPDPTNIRRCAKCGAGPRATIHRAGKRHAGPGHAPVVTGHVKNNPGRARKALKADHAAHLDRLEEAFTGPLHDLFAAQARSATAHRTWTRRSVRELLEQRVTAPNTPPDPPPGGTPPANPPAPPVDPTAIFDPAYWTGRTAEALAAGYQAAAGEAIRRVRTQLPEVGDEISSHAEPVVTAALAGRAETVAAQITRTTYQQIATALAEGIANGESTAQLADRVKQVFTTATDARAALIARTEANSASNIAQNVYANSLPLGIVAGREWLAVDDPRTRHDHAVADRQRQPMGVPFRVGGYPMMHPGDPTAPPSETCNCRCTTVFIPQAQAHLLTQRQSAAAA